MAKIALIDDDQELLEVLALAFQSAGHSVITAKDGAVGLRRIADEAPEVVVCDVNMPALDGFSLCRQLRAAGNLVPLLLLTSRDSDIDEALGLELGADDYVQKPFSTRVLLARVAALLRREAARARSTEVAHADDALALDEALRLDDERLSVTYQGKAVVVTVTEFRLLQALHARPGVVHSRARLLELLRGDEVIVSERIIDTYVRRLRRKLLDIDASFSGIETVVGAGYRWRDDA